MALYNDDMPRQGAGASHSREGDMGDGAMTADEMRAYCRAQLGYITLDTATDTATLAILMRHLDAAVAEIEALPCE